MPDLTLEKPRCLACGSTLLVRRFYRIVDGRLIPYRDGEDIDQGNCHELTICGRCDRR